MTYQTRRRLKRTIAALRIERENHLAEAARAHEEHEAQVDGLKLALRDIEAARDKAVRKADELQALVRDLSQLVADTHRRAERLQLAWYSARGRAAALRRHHDAAADQLADHTPAVTETGVTFTDPTDAGWWKTPWRPHP